MEKIKADNYGCCAKNIPDYLQVLWQDLDCLDVPNINVDVKYNDMSSLKCLVTQLINTCHALTLQQKQHVRSLRDGKLEINRLNNEVQQLKQKNIQFDKDVSTKATEVARLKDKQRQVKYELEEQKKENILKTKQIQEISKNNQRTRQRLDNISKKEDDHTLPKYYGVFATSEKQTIDNLKRQIELYKETTHMLQTNNESLVNEVLNLKEDLILCSGRK